MYVVHNVQSLISLSKSCIIDLGLIQLHINLSYSKLSLDRCILQEWISNCEGKKKNTIVESTPIETCYFCGITDRSIHDDTVRKKKTHLSSCILSH